MAADRTALAARQAQLLESLISGEDFPDGFAEEKAAAASLSLRRKRGRAVEAAWPALAHALGEEFEPRFHAFARQVAAPAAGGAIADGLAFVRRGLAGVALTDEARVEVLFARAGLARVLWFGAIGLGEPRRWLVVWRLPWLGVGQLVVPLAPG